MLKDSTELSYTQFSGLFNPFLQSVCIFFCSYPFFLLNSVQIKILNNIQIKAVLTADRFIPEMLSKQGLSQFALPFYQLNELCFYINYMYNLIVSNSTL